MRQYLYIDKANLEIALHYLRTGGAPTALVVDGEAAELREALPPFAREFPFFNLGESTRADIPGRADFQDVELVLCIEAKLFPLKFYPAGSLHALGEHYPRVRQLWNMGFRRFRFVSTAGQFATTIHELLDSFSGVHRGKRAFVVGNGPSLNQLDMSHLREEITLGANRGYLGFANWGFPFTYWGITDRLQIEEYCDEYRLNLPASMTKFYPFEYQPLLGSWENGCPVNFSYKPGPPHLFSNDPGILHMGFTVTHMLMQVAVIMGCNPIILIGVDHQYNLKPKQQARKGRVRKKLDQMRNWPSTRALRYYRDLRFGKKAPTPAKTEFWVASDATRPTHFSGQYTEGTKKFIMPRPELTERAMDAAAAWAQENGVTFLNATPGSALNSFPKVDFDELFK